MTLVFPVRSAKVDLTEWYRQQAAVEDFSYLAGRHGDDAWRRSSLGMITQHVDFSPEHKVLDIGCGDASLFGMIGPVACGVGTALTEEECARLQAAPHLSAFRFYASPYERLAQTVKEGPFDRIILNATLSHAGTKEKAHAAMQNIMALLKPGGLLWLGELYGKRYRKEFRSKIKAVRYAARYGMPFAFRFARHIVHRWDRASLIVVSNGRSWFITPGEVPEFAARYGLTVEGIWDCFAETGNRRYLSCGRFSVLFRRPLN